MRCDLGAILEIAEKRGCAIPAFNVYNMETVLGVMNAAKETKSPVIFQIYSRLFDSREARYVAALVREAMDELETPAVLHIDHGAGQAEVMRAIRYGATGVMMDASAKPLAENIAETRRIVELAEMVGVSVEGELGHIGLARDEILSNYTDIEEAVRFAEETGIKALAVMVGTAHGNYIKEPELAIDRIRHIHRAVEAALVLHGGSGVPDDQIRQAIQAGIRKVNFSTDLCCAYLNEILEADRDIVAVDLFMKGPMEAVKNFSISKIKLLGADA